MKIPNHRFYCEGGRDRGQTAGRLPEPAPVGSLTLLKAVALPSSAEPDRPLSLSPTTQRASCSGLHCPLVGRGGSAGRPQPLVPPHPPWAPGGRRCPLAPLKKVTPELHTPPRGALLPAPRPRQGHSPPRLPPTEANIRVTNSPKSWWMAWDVAVRWPSAMSGNTLCRLQGGCGDTGGCTELSGHCTASRSDPRASGEPARAFAAIGPTARDTAPPSCDSRHLHTPQHPGGGSPRPILSSEPWCTSTHPRGLTDPD